MDQLPHQFANTWMLGINKEMSLVMVVI